MSRDEREWTLKNQAKWAEEHSSAWGGDFIWDGPQLADDESITVVPKTALEAVERALARAVRDRDCYLEERNNHILAEAEVDRLRSGLPRVSREKLFGCHFRPLRATR